MVSCHCIIVVQCTIKYSTTCSTVSKSKEKPGIKHYVRYKYLFSCCLDAELRIGGQTALVDNGLQGTENVLNQSKLLLFNS